MYLPYQKVAKKIENIVIEPPHVLRDFRYDTFSTHEFVNSFNTYFSKDAA
jgi:hypothetical protein